MAGFRKIAGAVIAIGLSGSAAQASRTSDSMHQDALALAIKSRTLWSAELRDYRTARFRNVRLGFYIPPAGDMKGVPFLYFCGEYNARNGYGGYSGWDQFAVAPGLFGLAIYTGTQGGYDGAANVRIRSNLCIENVSKARLMKYDDYDYSSVMAYHPPAPHLRTSAN